MNADDLDLLFDVPDACKWCGEVHWTMDEAVTCWKEHGCPTEWPEPPEPLHQEAVQPR